MRIASLSINNDPSRFAPLLERLDDAQPGVVRLRALKAGHGAFPAKPWPRHPPAWIEIDL